MSDRWFYRSVTFINSHSTLGFIFHFYVMKNAIHLGFCFYFAFSMLLQFYYLVFHYIIILRYIFFIFNITCFTSLFTPYKNHFKQIISTLMTFQFMYKFSLWIYIKINIFDIQRPCGTNHLDVRAISDPAISTQISCQVAVGWMEELWSPHFPVLIIKVIRACERHNTVSKTYGQHWLGLLSYIDVQ